MTQLVSTAAIPPVGKSGGTTIKTLILKALFFWAVFAALASSSFWEEAEYLGFDLLTILNVPAELPRDLVIVGIDEPSFAELQKQWPWPRSWHAGLVRQLHAHGAKAVGLDILFAEPSAADEDRQLAAAIAAAGNVVLAKDKAILETVQFSQLMTIEPLPELLLAGAQAGFVGIPLERDLVARRVPAEPDSFARVVKAMVLPQSASFAENSADDDLLVRYYGPAQTLPYVSYYQALDPARYLPAGVFQGKIVLVGLNISSSADPGKTAPDRFGTPFLAYSGQLAAGVEIHATLVANALSGDALRRVSLQGQLGLLAAVMLAGALALRGWSPLRSAALITVMIILMGMSAWALFVFGGLWWPCLAPAAGLVGFYLLEGGISFVEERRRRLQLKRSFSCYVSPHVVEQVTANPELLKLGGDRRELTVLFTDLAGFTALAEQHPPEQVTAFLNFYLTQQTRIIHRFDGTVDKFVGDAIMAFWGAPLDCPDHARRACLAAREMCASMAALREEFAARGWPELRMRAGLNSGVATVGNMGSMERFDYTAIGDDVNQASRLEGVNKLYGTEVLLSGATAGQVGSDIPLQFVDRVRVKGKQQAIDIFTFPREGARHELMNVAREHYLRGNWSAALDAWQQILEQCPGDGIASVYVQRLLKFIAEGGPVPWDGAVSLEKF